MDDILDRLSGNFWFITLDLKSSYWQIGIRLEDWEKTVCSVRSDLNFSLCDAVTFEQNLWEKFYMKFYTKFV